jgi:hypothetical protein
MDSLKFLFALFAQARMLKRMNKECDKYLKIKFRLDRQQSIVNSLERQYKAKYGEDIRLQKEQYDLYKKIRQ